MPTTISNLLDKVSLQSTGVTLKWTGVVNWGELVSSNEHGIYIVSLSADPNKNCGVLDNAPIDLGVVFQWLSWVPKLVLDNNVRPSANELAIRLSEFWLSNESILYIGQTSGKTTTLRTRVGKLYRHRLGKRSPHRGGHWIQALSILEKTYVHYIELYPKTNEEQPAGEIAAAKPLKNKIQLKIIEEQLIGEFAAAVSPQIKKQLRDPERPFPFGNINLPNVGNKKHGIKNQTV